MALFRRSSGDPRDAQSSKQTITLKGPLEMRSGHPLLSEEIRTQLKRQGVDPAQVEAALENAPGGTKRLFSVNENGVKGTFEIRDGRPVLTDASRAELEQQGVDAAAFQAGFQARVDVNDRGEIVPKAQLVSDSAQPGAESARPFFRKPSEDDLLRGPGTSRRA